MALPILEWNSKKLGDSDAIARMLAKMYGLAGRGIFEEAQADAMIGILNDFATAAIEYMKLRLLNRPIRDKSWEYLNRQLKSISGF